ncbi:serine/threonine-protein kinase [Nesterenkonia marinintestina]|uniref:serine/threonine-protein kinase n=1 Tax=Nesterenkonia marinintestina TaxID=2979865 RepID=UPI0021C1F712|nr:serine/threonine-protein kinase [Nesterenkonia sp. GX14115]
MDTDDTAHPADISEDADAADSVFEDRSDGGSRGLPGASSALRRGEPPYAPGLRMGRLLGTGGSSAVWSADVVSRASSGTTSQDPMAEPRDSEDGPIWCRGTEVPARVAVKVCAGGAARPDRLRAELEAMRPLRHEHLVTPHGWVSTSQGPALLLEQFAGGSLGRLLTVRGSLSPGELTTVLSPVAEAVGHLHRSGAVHGDVSPGNILLAPDGRPALADLGDAQLLGARATTAGTTGFRAPERGRADGKEGGSELACAADVYSLGAVAWFTLTGEHPGPDHRRTPLGAVRPELAERLIDLIDDAVSEDPSRRPTAQEFAIGLFVAASPETIDLSQHVDDEVVAELPTSRSPVRPTRGRRPARWAAGAVTLTCGIGLLGWVALPSTEPPDRSGSESPSTAQDAEDGADDEADDAEEEADEDDDDAMGEERAALASDDPDTLVEGLEDLRAAALLDPAAVGPDAYTLDGSGAREAEEIMLSAAEEAGPSDSEAVMSIDVVDGDAVPREFNDGDRAFAIPVVVTATEFGGGAEQSQHVRLEFAWAEDRWLLESISETT